ncbi:hypothetical protein SERLADRAFT_406684 [Serpula lacrymans var. lacrymans S7.9]|uniref:Uncharacterized protein n=1 Tax=Serpula lacrymans var. lacrymans (strain S7.9) TaxID=578457 RepID=F8NP95_SERL9|nr:uncharacterized protein SERLADRAFT_406684 [Serpula lacrymans var. lacrymans S7.9]EGO27660.1 hypothetical protein SERLADRAFT_406684 [Serpula lacrymans var. lacrymans S7.9]
MKGVQLFHEITKFISLWSTFLYCHMPIVPSTRRDDVEQPNKRKGKEAWERSRALLTTEIASVVSQLAGRHLECQDNELIEAKDGDDNQASIGLAPDMEPVAPEEDLEARSHQPDVRLEENRSQSETHVGLEADHPSFVPHIELSACTSASRSELQVKVVEPDHDSCQLQHSHLHSFPCTSSATEQLSQIDPNDMISTQTASHLILPSVAGDLPYACCTGLVCDYDKENETLLTLRRERRNIVLDASCPHSAPHIVISPPELSWDDYFIPLQNRLEPQWPDYLAVPPILYGLSTPSPPPSGDCPDNLTPFIGIITELYNDLLQAYVASQKAPAFRARYDTPFFVQSLEKPFEWSDPAQPLISSCRHFLGVTLLESDRPCTVPHIMISEPAPQNPWVAWQNAINPQDDTYLSIFPRCITFVGTDELPIHDNDGEARAAELAIDEMDQLESDIPSRPDSPVPESPPDDDEVGYFHVAADADTCEMDPARCYIDPFSQWNQKPTCYDHSNSAPYSQPSCDIRITEFDEDEDDSLPPFDDWYTSVLERAKGTAMC